MTTSRQKKKIVVATLAVAILALVILYLNQTYDINWQDAKTSIQKAPAWIFLVTLIFLPPFGVPLSLFLFAVGARFGLWNGALIACCAIVGHHAVAIGMSRVFSQFISTNESQTGLWQKLERKAGGNSSKLLFLWGLLPGLPYIVKLYLPLAMGVKASPYLRWNSSGHALGAVLFVAFGNAVFEGLSVGAITVIILGIVLSLGLKIYRDRLKRNNEAETGLTHAERASR